MSNKRAYTLQPNTNILALKLWAFQMDPETYNADFLENKTHDFD
jgi:hypothetical protein